VTEYEYLVRELNQMIETRAQSVADGSCKTYEEYKHTTGIIRGLALAVDFLKDYEQKLEDSDE
jgi:hypothetical protein